MSVHYALCRGAGIPLCGNCRRHVDHNPDAAKDSYQPFVSPNTSGAQCAEWLAKPAPNFPKTDTGD